MKSFWKALTHRSASRKKNARRSPNRRLAGRVEALEPRAMMAPLIDLSPETKELLVIGTDNPETITFQMKNAHQVEVSVVDLVTKQTWKQAFSGVKKITAAGAGGDDIIINNTNIPDALFGHQGNDTLKGGTGDSFLNGGDGTDTLQGRGGNDILFGGNGTDTLHGGSGDDWLFGDLGNDTLFGDAGDDHLFGDIFMGDSAGGGNDTLNGGAGQDELVGQAGNDFLDGGGDGVQDTLWGGYGADQFVQHGAWNEDLLSDVKKSEGDVVKCAGPKIPQIAQPASAGRLYPWGDADPGFDIWDSHDNPLSRVAFNPQPEPPRVKLAATGFDNPLSRVAFNPQPEPPGEPWMAATGFDDPLSRVAFNPQPEPPGAPLAPLAGQKAHK